MKINLLNFGILICHIQNLHQYYNQIKYLYIYYFKYFNLLIGFTTFAFIEKNNKINIFSNILVGTSVII